MKIRLINCDPTNRAEIRAAMKFYALKLFSSRMIKHLEFQVKFIPNLNKEESLRGEIHSCVGRPRKFHIRIASDISLRLQLLTLAHEMAHAKQYAYGEMREVGKQWTRWNGELLEETDRNYWNRPWEVDARDWETALYEEYKSYKKQNRD
jgi:hypothetical protein